MLVYHIVYRHDKSEINKTLVNSCKLRINDNIHEVEGLKALLVERMVGEVVMEEKDQTLTTWPGGALTTPTQVFSRHVKANNVAKTIT